MSERIQKNYLEQIQSERIQGHYKKLIDLAESFLVDEQVTETTKHAIIIEKAIAFASLGLYKRTLEEIQSCIIALEDNKEYKILSRAYTILATTSSDLGHNDEAEKYFKKALDISLNNDYTMATYALYVNFSVMCRKNKNYEKALEYLEKAYHCITPQDERALVGYYANLAIVKANLNHLNEAEGFFLKAIELAKKNNVESKIAFIYSNYATAFMHQKEKAENLLFTSVEYAKKYNQKTVLALNYNNLSEFYNQTGSYKQAYEYLRLFNELDKEINDGRTKESYQLIQHQLELERHKKTIEVTKNRNQQLSEVNRKLEELLSIKNRLFSIIGHDLRGSVSAIVSSFDLLKASPNLSEEKIHEYYNKIQDSVFNIQSFLNDLLMWGQTINGDLFIQKEQLCIQALATKVMELHQYQMNLKNLEIELDIDDNIFCFADSFMIQTIMRNLLSNAIKFSHPGAKVIIGAKKEKKMCQIFVQDFGIGIPENIKEKIFDVDFKYSRNGTKNEKGNGFGLLLCAEFASKLGGNLVVESKENLGSKFILLIPTQ
jgi:signal transduction histidine kinase